MKLLNVFGKITDYATRIFAYIAAAALVFNVVIVLINVILRAFGSSVIGVEEYISRAEVVLIFLALGYAQYNKGLVHVCFFMKKIPEIIPIVKKLQKKPEGNGKEKQKIWMRKKLICIF